MRIVWRGSVVVLLLIVALSISWLPWRELVHLDSSSADEPATPPAVERTEPLTGLDITPSPATPLATPSAAAPSAVEPVPAVEPTIAIAAKVVELTNVARTAGGCAPVRNDAHLATAAAQHSQDMANRNYFSHTTPEGLDPWQRAKTAGYAKPTGENIAMGYPDAAAVMAGWMKSPGHKANIMNCKSKAVGVGVARGGKGLYWTQVFGSQ